MLVAHFTVHCFTVIDSHYFLALLKHNYLVYLLEVINLVNVAIVLACVLDLALSVVDSA